MSIALAVGIAISSRTVSTIRRTVNIDSSARALSVAEAAAEYYLAQPQSYLKDKTGGNTSDCGTTWTTEYPEVNQPPIVDANGITASALVQISRFGCVSKQNYTSKLPIDEVLEIKLTPGDFSGGSLTVSWTPTTPLADPKPSLYFVEVHKDGTDYFTRRYGYNPFDGSNSSNNFESAPQPYQNGGKTTITLDNTAQVLRIMGLYSESTVVVNPEFSLPFQGYTIRAVGQIGPNKLTNKNPKRIVSVSITRPYAPALFNFGMFSDSAKSGISWQSPD